MSQVLGLLPSSGTNVLIESFGPNASYLLHKVIDLVIRETFCCRTHGVYLSGLDYPQWKAEWTSLGSGDLGAQKWRLQNQKSSGLHQWVHKMPKWLRIQYGTTPIWITVLWTRCEFLNISKNSQSCLSYILHRLSVVSQLSLSCLSVVSQLSLSCLSVFLSCLLVGS